MELTATVWGNTVCSRVPLRSNIKIHTYANRNYYTHWYLSSWILGSVSAITTPMSLNLLAFDS